MSDINPNGGSQAVNIRSVTSLETRRDVARTSGDAVESPTNEVSNSAAQITQIGQGDRNNNTQGEQKDPLERAAETLQALIPADEIANTSLRIDKDENSGRFVYQSVDNDTGEVVKQFPPEDLLDLLSNLRQVEGIAIDDIA